ncbi:Membrane protein [Gammaproteobacteria bacterium]
MAFLLSKILWVFASPANFLVFFLFFGALFQYFRNQTLVRFGKKIVLSVAVVFITCTFLPIDAWLAYSLESRFPIPVLPSRIDGIIVLSGMIDPSASSVWHSPKLNHNASRITEFVYLARQHPEAKLVFSGGTGSVLDPDILESTFAKEIFSHLGFPLERILFEEKSRNTYENVQFSQSLVQPKSDEVWVLVTSAIHMPRAAGVFKKLNWKVIPYPVSFQTGRNALFRSPLGFSKSLFQIDEVVHEWIGLVAYHLMGQTEDWY